MDIPQRTLEKLSADWPQGTRHAAKITLALPLLGSGVPPEAVSITLQSKFPQATQREINDVIKWCVSRNPQPVKQFKSSSTMKSAQSPQAEAESFLHGFRCTETDLTNASPCAPCGFIGQAYILFIGLYQPEEYLNIVTKFTLSDKGKQNPSGAGKTMKRDQWLDWMDNHQKAPASQAGAWVRPNPVTPSGSGKDGAICNSDVASHRFLILESDTLPLELQLSLYAKLKFPISALISSGGKSVHAWVRINASSSEQYTEKAARLFGVIAKFGFDCANKNPSRLSRLPGVLRNGNQQRLIYLNQHPQNARIL